MRMKWGQDLASGVLFIFVGLGSLFTVYFFDKLPMGSPQRPGTGVLPVMLSWGLIAIGIVLGAKSITVGDVAITNFAWKQLFFVTLGTVAFGLMIDNLGLVATMIVSMTLCAMATDEIRPREFTYFTVIMIVSSWATFIWLLGMPIPTWPLKLQSHLGSLFH